jgi:hypothetical protein
MQLKWLVEQAFEKKTFGTYPQSNPSSKANISAVSIDLATHLDFVDELCMTLHLPRASRRQTIYPTSELLSRFD